MANVVGSGANAVHWAHSDEGSEVVRALIPDVELQLAAPMLAKVTPVAGAFGNEQEGKELALVDWKSLGFPKKSQRSVTSPFVLFPVVAVPILKPFPF